nr:hypothetical protein [Tanacetum cinerariifolium]
MFFKCHATMSSDDKAGDNTANDVAGKEKVQEPVSEYDQALKNVLPVSSREGSRTFIPPHDPLKLELEDTAKIQTTGIFGNVYDEDDLEPNNHSYADESVGAEANFNNMEPSTVFSPILTTRVHSNHPTAQIIGDPMSTVQTRVRNKARLVVQGHKQEEGIDYDEVFAPVARVEAIRLFLAFASYMNFPVYRMDVKVLFSMALLNRSIRSESTPMETHNPLTKDENGEDVDVHLYRSMIGSLMYLTSSRPDIMFSVCACLRFQVQPKVSHLHTVKRIFRYLIGQPKLGLWYHKDSTLIVEAFLTVTMRVQAWTGNPQQENLDYGYNFMQTKIHVDNQSAICVIKNPVYHSKAKHIEIRHHFIRDSYEKRLIEMVKIHTNNNVADLLTKAFDKSEGSDNPTIYASLIEQFWQNAALSTIKDGVMAINATIDRNVKVYSSALTKLILRVKKLERTVKTSKARRKARIVISENEDAEDPSKQGRSLIE